MPTLEITNIDNGTVEAGSNEFRDGLFTAGSAKTYLAGTILATDTTTKKFIPFVKGGVTAGNGVPTAVLQRDLVAAGAGDISIRPIISGKVRTQKLIIDADGTGANVDANVLNGLKASSIVDISVKQLAGLDNQ